MTQEEKYLINQIALDLDSGRFLIRTESAWKRVLRNCGENVKKSDYVDMMKELKTAINNFSWHSNEDKSTAREKEILIHFKCCQDYDFNVALKNEIMTNSSIAGKEV